MAKKQHNSLTLSSFCSSKLLILRGALSIVTMVSEVADTATASCHFSSTAGFFFFSLASLFFSFSSSFFFRFCSSFSFFLRSFSSFSRFFLSSLLRSSGGSRGGEGRSCTLGGSCWVGGASTDLSYKAMY